MFAMWQLETRRRVGFLLLVQRVLSLVQDQLTILTLLSNFGHFWKFFTY